MLKPFWRFLLKSLRLIFFLLIALAGIAVRARADDYTDASCSKPAAVTFAKGTSSAKYKGGFDRGEMDCWTVIAKQGQILTVNVDAIDKNASLDVYLPKYRIKHGSEGLDVTGTRLTPGGIGDRHITHWSGTLPASGRYLINIISERGNVTYDLSVAVADSK
jgi:hypothetical protein